MLLKTHAPHGLTRRDFLTQASVSAAALAAAGCGSGHRQPNILVLLTDNHRWDALSCAGNEFVRTPQIDSLAGDGALFEQAFTTSATPMASRASLLTGTCERAHGCNVNTGDLTPSRWAQSYPVLLGQAGYRTGFIGPFGFAVTDRSADGTNIAGTTWLDQANLPTDDFDAWHGIAGPGEYFPEGEGGPHLTGMLAEQARRFITETVSDQPWCLTVAFKSPGEPFTPDPSYAGMLEDAEIPLPLTFGGYFYDILPGFLKISHACYGSGSTGVFARRHSSLEHHRETMRSYYRLLAGVDDAVGRIRGELSSQGMADNTVIVFMGTTGDLQGEHYLAGNALLFEEAIRIPLIIHDPRVRSRGVRRAELTANIDIAPTLLDLAGIAAPPSMHGRSLIPLLRGGTDGWRSDLLLENHYRLASDDGSLIEDYPLSEGVRTDRWKYIRYSGQEPPVEQLFDLASDPGEAMDKVHNMDHRGTLVYLRNRLDALSGECGQ